ncbi:MAG: 2-keto-3-deoxy-L-rhamnonate aldolase [bacterium]|nr:2-keto-3-deoxy-L-rhamnonate aldolase [bacterium]
MNSSGCFRERLKGGEIGIGPILIIPSLHVSQMSATLEGVNFVWIDLEHGAIGRETASAMVASSRGRAAPLVRVTSGEHWLIKQALDMGAEGLVVPMVDTREEAEHIAQAILYPPAGFRGYGPDVAAQTWGIPIPQYFKRANDDITLVIQIESREGLKNAESIAAVERVDVLFAGAFDISVALGKPGKVEEPDVEAAILSVRDAAHKHGKKAGTIALDPVLGQKRLNQGFDFLVTATDMVLLTRAMAEYVAALKVPSK